MSGRTKALLLAGGLGTRLRPLTETVPKCLVPVAGRPLLDYWLDALEAAGIEEALINTHHLRDVVRAHIDRANAKRGLTLHETREAELLGSAGTVHANRGWADGADAILVVYADNLSTVDLGRLIDFHHGHDDPVTMLVFHAANPSQCGIATVDGDGRIVEFVEKPERPASDLANGGIYVVDGDAWREMADMDGFDLAFDILPRFLGRMRAYPFDGYHRDIGTPEALAQAEADAPRQFGTAP